MSNIITIGYITEGSTDVRFLQNVIRRTFEEISFECQSEIEVWEPEHLKIKKSSFVELVTHAAFEAEKTGLMVLCIHTDADADSDLTVLENKFEPAMKAIAAIQEGLCKNLVPIVPVQMTEAWMLADKEKLKEEMSTTKSDSDLGLYRDPEQIARPKEVLEHAIRIALADLPRKRKYQLDLSDLYQPLGQKIRLEKLENLPSYKKFKEAVRVAFQRLNYLP